MLSPVSRADNLNPTSFLGLMPQALCCHLLRRFSGLRVPGKRFPGMHSRLARLSTFVYPAKSKQFTEKSTVTRNSTSDHSTSKPRAHHLPRRQLPYSST